MKNSKRGSAYPVLDLERALKIATDIEKKSGKGPTPVDGLPAAMGHESLSGPARRKIAALTYFGLLFKNKDGKYSLTPLYERIIRPTSENEKTFGIQEAAKKPTLFARLYEKYQGQKLPELLHNELAREYQIIAGQSQIVREIFEKSMQFAKLMESDGKLTGAENTEAAIETTNTDSNRNRAVSPEPSMSRKPLMGDEIYSLPLFGGVELKYPSSLNKLFVLGSFAKEIQDLETKIKEISKSNGGAN